MNGDSSTKSDHSGDGKTVKWLRENFSGIVVVLGACVVTYAGLSIAQNDIEHLEADVLAQAAAVDKVDVIETNQNNLKDTVERYIVTNEKAHEGIITQLNASEKRILAAIQAAK
jgi:predicted regulator of Ras-like GTPase activity (Roadblock/LC7/MglB family)